jgi:hypothetical protein
MGRDSGAGIATRRRAERVGGSNPGGREISWAYPDRPWGPPSLMFNEYRVSLWGKAAEAWS